MVEFFLLTVLQVFTPFLTIVAFAITTSATAGNWSDPFSSGHHKDQLLPVLSHFGDYNQLGEVKYEPKQRTH